MTYDWDGRRTKRLRWVKIIGSGLIGAAALAMACFAPHARAQSFAMVTGKCQKLVAGKDDFTAHCSPKLLSTAYTDGRIGFYFLLRNNAVLTISGKDLPDPTPDTDETKVDKVIVNLGIKDVPSASQPARGKCLYGNPARPMTITCKGALKSGDKFIAVFRTDGNPPQ